MTALPSPAPVERHVTVERSPSYQSSPHSVFYPSPPPAPVPNFALHQGYVTSVEALEDELNELEEVLRDEADSALERDPGGMHRFVRSRPGDP
jgi:hypothetical protein